MKKQANGFTLIELLLVVVIISILSGIVLSVINVAGLRARTRDAQRAGDLKRIQTALELYFTDYRGYPANAGAWLTVVSSGADVLNNALKGAYIQILPQDPMNNTNIPSGSVCGQSKYGYYYQTDSCVGAGCLASVYVLATVMETQSSADTSKCSDLPNCKGPTAKIPACVGCGSPCYGVENPL